MPGLGGAVVALATVAAATLAVLALLAASGAFGLLAAETPPARITPPAVSPASLPGVQRAAWTIGRAGLTGPSAWLTAPRETAEFAARRAAILAAYERADHETTLALRRAGMTKRKGWTCE